MKNPYIILKNNKINEIKIIMRDSFTKGDKLKDFLADNKGYTIQMMFV